MYKILTLLTLFIFFSLTSMTAQPVLSLANASTTPGSNVTVDLDVQNFTNVGAISLKLLYDPAKIEFINITNVPAGKSFLANAAGGVITLGWFDASGVSPINIANGKLLDLNFNYIDGYAPLNFNLPLCEISNALGNPIPSTYLNGSISSPQFKLLEENFDYPAGDLLSVHGWNLTGTSTTNAIPVASPGLTFNNYALSGIGNAASLTTTGQDVNKQYSDSITTGTVYASFMVNVASAQAAGDYFAHLGVNPTNTFEFYGRTFVRLASNGNLSFGISKSSVNASNPAAYSDSIFSTGTTYLLVIKYSFEAGDTNDVVSLFINPNINPSEPSATLTVTTNQTDAASLGVFNLRQGSSSNAPNVIVDGIRVATTWEGVVPVELTSFSANVTGKQVSLNWSTATEINNSGFEVQRSSDGKSYSSLSFIPGRGTTSERSSYSYVDNSIVAGSKYYYRLKQIDLDGTFEYSNVVFADVTQPDVYSLLQNYPNPFNPATTISFNIPVDARVKVRLFDVLGKEVQQVINNNLPAGNHSYNLNFSELSSGVYIYRLEAEGSDGSSFSSERKMTLTK